MPEGKDPKFDPHFLGGQGIGKNEGRIDVEDRSGESGIVVEEPEAAAEQEQGVSPALINGRRVEFVKRSGDDLIFDGDFLTQSMTAELRERGAVILEMPYDLVQAIFIIFEGDEKDVELDEDGLPENFPVDDAFAKFCVNFGADLATAIEEDHGMLVEATLTLPSNFKDAGCKITFTRKSLGST